MRTDTRIRFTQDWRQWAKGDVIDPGFGPAVIYVDDGKAEWFTDENGDQVAPQKRKRGRRAKMRPGLVKKLS